MSYTYKMKPHSYLWDNNRMVSLQRSGLDGMAAIGLWMMALSFAMELQPPWLRRTHITLLCGGDTDLADRCTRLLLEVGLFERVELDESEHGDLYRALALELPEWPETPPEGNTRTDDDQ